MTTLMARMRTLPWRSVAVLLCLYLALGLLFQGLSLHFGYHRHFLSAEVLGGLLLLAMGWRWLGAGCLLAAIGLELALGLTSVFYLFDPGQLLDMSEYLFEARHAYLVALALLPVVAAFAIWLAVREGCRAAPGRSLALVLVLLALLLFRVQWVVSSEQATFFTPTLAKRQQLVFGSSVHFLGELMAENRVRVLGNGGQENAEYVPIRHDSAARKVWGAGLPAAPRVLLVLAEAWGLPADESLLASQVKALRQSVHVAGFRLDAVHAMGATAAGELRELCALVPTRLNFRLLTASAVGECLPKRLHEAGFATVGIHGASAYMYHRNLWWPQLGLETPLFHDDIALPGPGCHSFPGHCDHDLLPVVRQHLAQERVFVYWMTLNSHVPYDRRDIARYREQLCFLPSGQAYSEQLCNYQNLHTQFFEGLATLAEDPTMKGVEVLVVGDHPPMFNDAQAREMFSKDQVPMLHFVVQ